MPNRTKHETSLGEKIKFFRERAGLSQMGLELQARMSAGTISRIENNSIDPSNFTLHKISDVLRLDSKETAYLFNINLYNITQIQEGKPILNTNNG